MKATPDKELIYEDNSLYLFDFDGTIYPDDSMVEFLKFYNGKWSFYFIMIGFIWPTALYCLRIIDKQVWKERLLLLFLKGRSAEEINSKARLFAAKEKHKIFKEARDYIKHINNQKNVLYIISASLDIWLYPLLEDYNVAIICTKSKFKDGTFVGIQSKNCNAEEKVNALNNVEDLSKFHKIISFGNSSGDYSMYEISNDYFHKFFNK